MSCFDHTASAGLFAANGRSGLRYRRFPQTAEAIRYAMEKLPSKVFYGAPLEVNDERYNVAQIRALYETTFKISSLGVYSFGILPSCSDRTAPSNSHASSALPPCYASAAVFLHIALPYTGFTA